MTQIKTDFPLVLLLWGAGLGAAAQYGKVSVIYDQLTQVYPVGTAVQGLLVSVVGFTGIVFGVIAGVLVGQIGARRALTWALWGGAVISGLQALLPPLPIMLGLRVLEGVSHLAMVVSIPTLIAQLSASQHRGLTLTLWGTFFGVSYTALVWLGLPLVAAYGVSSLFVAHALWLALFAVVLSPRLAKDRIDPAPLNMGEVLKSHVDIYRSPRMAAPGLGWLFYTTCFLSLLTLLPPFIDPEHRVLVLGLMPLVSIASSMTLGVWMLRRLSAIQVVMTGFGLVIASLVWLLLAPGGAVACLVLFAAFGLVQGASFASVPELNDTQATQARANGALAQMGNIGNTAGTPVLALIIVGAGYTGLIVTAIVIMAAGLALHGILARRRSHL